MQILTHEASNKKLAKGAGKGYYTVGVSLAPYNLSGRNVCPKASEGCRVLCLNTAGNGMYSSVQNGRIRKTQAFFANRPAFLRQLRHELRLAQRKADRLGVKLACRLNVLSDIVWEKLDPTLFAEFPRVQFYDYTKIPGRVKLPENYHLTFSRTENTPLDTIGNLLYSGQNVAVVFDTARTKTLPETWNGFRVIDGDTSDLRFTDPTGVIVGLRAKGRARMARFVQTVPGFVVSTK